MITQPSTISLRDKISNMNFLKNSWNTRPSEIVDTDFSVKNSIQTVQQTYRNSIILKKPPISMNQSSNCHTLRNSINRDQ